MRHTLLRDAIRRSLLAYGAAGMSLAFAASAMAQDAAPENSQELAPITVTGTRIRKAEVETAQPIVVLDRATIEKQGFNSVADILQNLSEAGSPPISRANVLSAGEDVGGYYIDLRNLGNNRTLVLLDGKRLGATTSGAQDLSQIPIAAIERIEVLKDGASAIYGSDAIAGVVNIITRKHFDGAEADAYVGQYDQDDGTKQTYSMTLGAHNDRGSITMAAEYAKEDPVYAKNRWFSAYPQTSRHPTSGWTLVSQWGAFFFPDGSCPGQEDSPIGTCTLNPGGNPFDLNDYHGTNSAGGLSDRTNFNQEMFLQTGTERHSLFVTGDYQVLDRVKFSSDLLYNKRSTLQQVAGYPFQPAFALPGSDNLIGLSGDSYYNPFPGEDILFYRRGWEQPRTTQSDLETYRFAGTFEGDFEIGDHTWNWDVGGYTNRNDLTKVNHGDFSLIAVANALGPSFLDPVTGLVTCGTPDSPIPYGSAPGSCVPWNPMIPAGQGGSGSLSENEELRKYLFPFYTSTGRTKSTEYSANLTGALFSLPAGDLSIATGYEHRKESGTYVPDAFAQAGLSTNLSSGPTGGSYSLDEYYLEVDVPVLKDVPFAHELSFNVAGRYSKYDTFGDTTNGKFGLTWRPMDDLLLRGNYAQGFRAPTIADLYGGLSGTFDSYIDPCDTVSGAAATNPAVAQRCTSGASRPHAPANYQQIGQGGVPCSSYPCQTGIQFFSGSNPLLQPETATTKTLGVVYSPEWISGLDLSLDWFRIHIKNAISGDSVQQILDDCYLRDIASRCSALLFTRNADGVVNYALRGNTNQGWIDTEGYDLGVSYRIPETPIGRFTLHWDSTYIAHLDVKQTDDATVISPNTGIGSNFRLRSNASLDWSMGDFGATWTARYYSSMKEQCSSFAGECNMPDHVAPDTGALPFNRTGANTFHDVQVRWTSPWKGTISLGANNVFNHYGSVQYSQPNSTFNYYGGFDIGRFYYVRYSQKF